MRFSKNYEMKVLQLIVVFSLGITMYGQEPDRSLKKVMRYEYQLTYKPWDVTIEKNKMPLQEIFYLDVADLQSQFLPVALYNDFIGEDEEVESGFKCVVFNTGKHTETFEYLNFQQRVIVKQPLNLIKWNIQQDIAEQNGLKIQKAVGEFGGRKWTIWFAQDILVPEGPYKFKNLPGLVVKAEDDSGDYIFEFLNSQALDVTWITPEMFNAEEVTADQLKKLKKGNENKSIAQLVKESGGDVFFPNGNSDELQEHINEKFGKEPNPIELN